MKRYWMVITLALAFAASVIAQDVTTQNVTVEFWHTFGDELRLNWIQDRANEYNAANPGLEVVPVYKGISDETLQATVLAARQGNAPALVQVDGVSSQLALDSGIFQPVSAVTDVDFSDYIEPVISYYTIGGAVNSVPFNSSSPVLYFNKDLMTQAGLDPENPPTTFGEVMETCAAFDAANLGVACVALTPYSWLFEQWMSEQNAELLNNGNGREARATASNVDSDAGRNIFQFYKDLNDQGYLTNTGKLADTVGTNGIFSEQKALMTVNSIAGLGNLLAASEESGFELGVGVLPIPDGTERNGVIIGGASLWVAESIPQEQAETALDFALFITNTENMASWHKTTGYYPVRNSSVELLREEGWLESNPLQLVAFNQLLETVPNVANAGALTGANIQMRTILEESIQKVLSGQDVAEVATTAKEQINTALLEYNKNFE
jgi:sn-glycerol 3-phosphate transport system substrate-binding protein